MNQYRKILFDKSIYGINLLEARSRFRSYSNEENFSQDKREETILSGIWKGKCFDDYPENIETYLDEKYDIEQEKDVEVPLSCELQGFGQPQYVNTEYPFDGYNHNATGEALSVKNPCMVYWKDLDLNLSNNERYILDIKGFESGLFLYVNGKSVGYSENLYLDSEFDITPYLQNGKNRLTLLCFKYSSSSWLLDQDFFRFMGLFRDVSLFTLPKKHIYDIFIDTDVTLQNHTGEVSLKLVGELENTTKQVMIIDKEGKTILEDSFKENEWKTNLSNIALWSAEEPNLYTMIVKLKEEDKTIEIIEEHFGFKKVEIKEGLLLFNGKRLIVKGINRHEWNPDRGRNVTLEDIEFDREFLKQNNVNAIRTSHYPNRSEFYEMSDKAGFYVVDEACLESHGANLQYDGWITDDTPIPACKEEWITICTEKVRRMYLRDKNHPSIFMYSLGNEAGRGEVFAKMRETLLKMNPNLIIHYEGYNLYPEWSFLSDVTSTMYFRPEWIPSLLEKYPNKPYVQCEYAHAMGNSCGNLDEYHDLVRKYPSYQGGFIWDYIDQGLYFDGKKKSDHLHFGGDYLDKPNDHDFCCNGVIFADRKYAHLSSKALAMKHLYQPFYITKKDDKITIENELLFTTGKYRLTLSYLINGIKEDVLDSVIEMKPGDTYSFEVPSWTYHETDDVSITVSLYLLEDRFGLHKGDEISYQDFDIQKKIRKTHSKGNNKLRVVDGRYNIGVACGDFSLLFSKANISFAPSGLISIKYKDEEYLSLTALPTIFRATTNNDQTNDFLSKAKLCYSYSRFMTVDVKETTWKADDNFFEIRIHYLMDEVNKKGVFVTYTVTDEPNVHIKLEYEPLTGVKSLGEFGLHFYLAKDIEKLSYYGRYLESYSDRKEGNRLGIYDLDIEDGRTEYIYPQESGNREDTRYLQLKNKHTSLLFSYDQDYFSFHFQKYSSFSIDDAKHEEELGESNYHHLELLGLMRGVGGDDSWGSPVHPQYEIDGTIPHTFEFDLKPFDER